MAFSFTEKEHLKSKGIDLAKQPILFKRFFYTPWEPWAFLPPSKRTLEILRREAEATALAQPNKPKGAIFYGINVVAFKIQKTGEVLEVLPLPPDAFNVTEKKAA